MATIAVEDLPLAGSQSVEGLEATSQRRGLPLWWPRAALAPILVLAASLEFIGLSGEGYANSYYAAAVKSMLTSWHNFFYASFDAGGFVSVDKPPLGLWVEVASAKLFGFSGISMLVPEALAGVLSVGLLYLLVARPFGPVAGLVAALALAITPITAITDRNNTIDSLLILTLLLAAWAAIEATQRGQLRFLLLSAVLVGFGFNIKMMQAYLVVPALALMYLLGAPRTWKARIAHLACALLALLIVSLAWLVAVDMTPAGSRPFVSDSGTNSALSLALGYNGLGRVTQALFSGLSGVHIFGITIDLNVVPAFAPEIGNPSILRLVTPVIAEQASWFLPLALIGLVAALIGLRWRLPLDERGQSVVLWAGWLAAASIFFSTGRFYHLYYLVMLAPPAAVLAGIGVASLWRLYARGAFDGRGLNRLVAWLLPAALLATAYLQFQILQAYPDWGGWLQPVLIAGSVVAALALTLALLRVHVQVAPGVVLEGTRIWAGTAVALALLVLAAAPAAWSAQSVADGDGSAWLPQAGPGGGATAGGGGAFGGARNGFGQGFGGQNRRFAQPGQGFSGQSGGSNVSGQGFNGQAGGFSRPGQSSGGSVGKIPGSAQQATGGGSAPGGQTQTTAGGNGFALGQGGSQRQFLGGGGFGSGRGGGFGGGSGGAMTFAGDQIPTLDAKLINYLIANQRGAKFLVATTSSSYASLFILQTNQPAMALGGYQGWDRILTPAQLAQAVASNTVRYFYIPAGGGDSQFTQANTGQSAITSSQLTGSTDATGDLTQWVRAHCTAVPSSQWQTTTSNSGGFGRGGGQQLYSCASLVKR